MRIFKGRSRKSLHDIANTAVADLHACLQELESMRVASGDPDGAFTDIMQAADQMIRDLRTHQFHLKNGARPGQERRGILALQKASRGFVRRHIQMKEHLRRRRQCHGTHKH